MSPIRRLGTIVLVAMSVAVLLPGCRRAKVEGEGRLDPDGRVLLTRDDQQATVGRPRSLVTGDAVEVTQGTATITLPGGDVLELRPRTVVVLADGPDLRRGSVLVSADGAPRTVRAAGSQVDAAGRIRIDVALALRVVAYGGRAVLRSGGQSRDVPALREASVPVIGVLRGPRAMAIDRADPWDQRFLGDSAAKELELERLASGFTDNVSAANASSVAYYRTVLPTLKGESAFRQAEVDRLGRPALDAAQQAGTARFRAGDVLLGAAIALQGRQGSFATRLARVTDFRALGASWSLVCLDEGVAIGDLQDVLDDAINAAPLELAAPASRTGSILAPEPLPARATTTTTTRPATARATGTTSTTRAPQQQTPPPTQPQPRPPIILPVDPLLDALVDPVVKLLNDLLGTPVR